MPNKPKILSNELDQVAKRGERYRQELLKEQLSDQIADAFNQTIEGYYPVWENYFFVSKSTDKAVLDRFIAHRGNLPVEQIEKMLKDKKVVSCELFRDQKSKDGWIKTVWPAIPKDHLSLWSVLVQKDLPIDGHDITYITFTKLNENCYPNVKISLQQVGFPGKWSMLPEYIVFHNELKGEKVATLKDF